MDQVIWRRAGPESKQKVTVFGAVQVAPEQTINQMPYFVDGGIVCSGPFPSRPLDYAGFELGCGTISADLKGAEEVDRAVAPAVPVQTYEMVLEWAYGIHAAPGVQVQPDLQYLINPGAGGRYPNALVVGVQLTINF
jgi:porin